MLIISLDKHHADQRAKATRDAAMNQESRNEESDAKDRQTASGDEEEITYGEYEVAMFETSDVICLYLYNYSQHQVYHHVQ